MAEKMTRRVYLMTFLALLLIVSGCGGGGGSKSASAPLTPGASPTGGASPTPTPSPTPVSVTLKRGTVTMKVAWSPLSRGVLDKAQSLVLQLETGDGGENTNPEQESRLKIGRAGEGGGEMAYVKTLVINRPATSGKFEEVIVGLAVITVTAYSEIDGEGDVVGGGSASVTVEAGKTTQAQVALSADSGNGGETGAVEVGVIENQPTPPATSEGPRQTLISISLDPAQDRYPRGTKVNIVVFLHSPNAPNDLPIQTASFRLYEEWQSIGTETYQERKVGDYTTGNDGKKIVRYTIPPTADKRNVRLWVEFDGNDKFQKHIDRLWHIPIGL